ncbi:phage tail tape measure protein [Haloarcula montana]|uniref:phage tail tape measure protein n=1 Tax=Haloarcula montana TaxID=3111776 RepID=UPI002D788CE2|nr:phage tail tape measure protein [Haloarcula sp. GH36]
MAITGAREEVQVEIGGDASSLQEATDDAAEGLRNMKVAVGVAGAALGALATGALAKATSAAADFEEQLVDVEKVTNPETAREMGTAIREMAAEMPIAQRELAGITEQAGRFGVEGSENIRQFTETVAQMSVATNLSAEEAGEAFARLATLTGEPISNVQNVGDVINELSNSMATSSSEITDAALRSAGTLSQLGASSEDIYALSAAINEASESAERAGTRLRRLAQELQDPQKASELAAVLDMTTEEFVALREEDPSELIAQLAEVMDEGTEQTDELRAALSTTSRQGLTALAQNMEGLSEAQEMANEQMGDGTSLAEEYQTASDTFNSELQVTQNRLQNIAIQIGQQTLPVASDLLAVINDYLERFSEFNRQTGGAAGTIALVTTALGGFTAAIASAVSLLGGISAAVGAVGAAISVLTGPIGIAIAAVAGLAAAWQTNFGDIRGHTDRGISAVRDIIGDGLTVIEDRWDEHGAEVVATTNSFVDETAAATEALVDENKTTLAALSTAVRRQLVLPLSDSESQIRQTLNSTGSEFSETFSMIRQTVSEVMTAVVSQFIRPALQNISRLYRQHFTGSDGILANTRTAFNAILNNVIRPALNQIQALWRAYDDDVLTLVRGLMGTLETVFTVGMDAILTSINVVLDLISGDFDGAWSSIVGLSKRSVGEIAEWIKTSGKQLLAGAFGILVTPIERRFKQLYNWLIGNSLIKDLIRDSASYVRNAGQETLTAAFGALAAGIENSLNIDISGVTDSIDDLIGDVEDAIDRLEDMSDIDVDVPEVPNFDPGNGDDGEDGSEEENGDGDDSSDDGDDGDDGFEFPDTPVSNPDPTDPSESEQDRGLVPGFASGGMVAESGLAMLHSPELVLSRQQTAEAQQGGVAVGDLDVTDDVARGVSEPMDQQTRALASRLDRAVALLDDVATEMQTMRRSASEPGRYDSL